jgi:integrase
MGAPCSLLDDLRWRCTSVNVDAGNYGSHSGYQPNLYPSDMAFLIKQPDRPYWLLRYRDAIKGRWVQKSTGLKVNDRNDTRSARELRDRYIAEEHALKPTSPAEAWPCWVQKFLTLRYSSPDNAKTLVRYQSCWRSLSAYLDFKGIKYPRQLSYEHLRDYFTWRKSPGHPAVRPCGHNTALSDVRLLALIIDEAIRLGFAERNPCRRIGVKRHAAKVKPEFTDLDIDVIRRALLNEEEWMRISFEIAIRHGTRLRATSISLEHDVDWNLNTVTFHEKGHKTFTVALHPELCILFQSLRSKGYKRTCTIPINASKYWRSFFDKIGKPQFCFHCCRVSVISKMARQGIPENQAQKFTGHASTEIHRRYQRIRVEDLHACHKVGCLPSLTEKKIFVPPARCQGRLPSPPLESMVIYDD